MDGRGRGWTRAWLGRTCVATLSDCQPSEYPGQRVNERRAHLVEDVFVFSLDVVRWQRPAEAQSFGLGLRPCLSEPSPSATMALPDSAPAPDPASGSASDDDLEAGDDVALDYRLLSKLCVPPSSPSPPLSSTAPLDSEPLLPTSAWSSTKKNKDGQISIPKRGEKDFEPLEKGQNVQGRALREGREAMFAALEGVRGGNLHVAPSCRPDVRLRAPFG